MFKQYIIFAGEVKMTTDKPLKWYKHIKRKDEDQYQERGGEEGSKPGGKILVKETWTCGVKCEGRIEQDKVE